MSALRPAENLRRRSPSGGGRDSTGAGDYMRALVSGYPARARAKKLMVVLQAFADDSASEAADKRLFLACYINGAEQWARFADGWDRELGRSPGIAHCKMAEAQNRSGQFKGWSESAVDDKVAALAQVVRRHRPWSVHCSVSRGEYDRILAPVAPANLKNPYFSCFWGLIHATARYHKGLGIEDVPPVDFVFDEQGGLGDEAVMWYRWLKEDQDPSIKGLLGATPVFRDDKQVVALQAADMLAWHLRRDHERGGSENRPAMELLLGHHAGVHFDAATLVGLAKRMGRVPGVAMVRDRSAWRGVKKDLQARSGSGLGPPSAGLLRLRLLYARVRVSRFLWRLLHGNRRRGPARGRKRSGTD